MEVYREHRCVVISDEIWSDLVLPGHTHVPTQSVSEDARRRTVALYAPSKTFNLAGLVGSYHIIYDDYLRDRVVAKSKKSCYNSMNVLSMHALIGAYGREGEAWLEELLQVLDGNVSWACRYIREHFEGVRVSKPEGTYMLFLDCSEWCEAHGRDIEWLEHAGWRVGVDWQDGRAFHGPCHVRMNLALPLSRVQEALRVQRVAAGMRPVAPERRRSGVSLAPPAPRPARGCTARKNARQNDRLLPVPWGNAPGERHESFSCAFLPRPAAGTGLVAPERRHSSDFVRTCCGNGPCGADLTPQRWFRTELLPERALWRQNGATARVSAGLAAKSRPPAPGRRQRGGANGPQQRARRAAPMPQDLR